MLALPQNRWPVTSGVPDFRRHYPLKRRSRSQRFGTQARRYFEAIEAARDPQTLPLDPGPAVVGAPTAALCAH